MLKAAATSVYGTILKIDSTKKICKKLQGLAANKASWATNVGNKRGEIVQSVLTSSESAVSLKKLADGLMSRYEKAGQTAPAVLYTDRDCCSSDGSSKYKELFGKWPNLEVCLDIWHFMRRLAVAVTSESHPLYDDSLFGTPIFPNYTPPAKFTGELIGVEYLLHQTEATFDGKDHLHQQIDEGFMDQKDDDLVLDEPFGTPALETYEVPVAELQMCDENGDDGADDEVKISFYKYTDQNQFQ